MPNFWDDLVEDVPDEITPTEVEEVAPSSGGTTSSTIHEDRAVSYLDVESTSLVDETPRQRLRDLFTQNCNRLHAEDGSLVQIIASNIGLTEQKTWELILSLRRRGLIDVVMVNKHRVYTITWNPEVENRAHEPKSTTPPRRSPQPAPVVEVDDIDDADLHAALAEAMWLRYEHAVSQVGQLTQRVEELEAELAQLRPRGSIVKRMLQ